MIYTLFVILIVLASILMIGIVLIQESKGGGLASNFSSSNSIMGVRKTNDVVEKATWVLAAAMVVISVVCAYVAPTAVTDQSVMENNAIENAATNPNNAPGFGASQTPATGQQPNGASQQSATPAAKPSSAK
ncbi:preprotein translocase subunit SecG [Prevotella sp. A2931]|uniref:Protein-export membrane protein SecG n=1 Tax=Prevotella illustrans TaxID=2800387 RepID=A0ABS3M435_9BACT|nr:MULTISPECIES: preprotein translocase subunit SecG [Prevotella]MBO1362951.1 preprotein translocase subunit SecG [Prevotella illustrans]PTL27144.1 preprotein translocase subunit SecG [Prevotella sp. oral taxon 820]